MVWILFWLIKPTFLSELFNISSLLFWLNARGISIGTVLLSSVSNECCPAFKLYILSKILCANWLWTNDSFESSNVGKIESFRID